MQKWVILGLGGLVGAVLFFRSRRVSAAEQALAEHGFQDAEHAAAEGYRVLETEEGIVTVAPETGYEAWLLRGGDTSKGVPSEWGARAILERTGCCPEHWAAFKGKCVRLKDGQLSVSMREAGYRVAGSPGCWYVVK